MYYIVRRMYSVLMQQGVQSTQFNLAVGSGYFGPLKKPKDKKLNPLENNSKLKTLAKLGKGTRKIDMLSLIKGKCQIKDNIY